MSNPEDYAIEYLTNGGGYHCFRISTDCREMAVKSLMVRKPGSEKLRIVKAVINTQSLENNKFTMFGGFRVNEFMP